MQLDQQVKEESEAIFRELGMSLETAINLFLRQALKEGGLLFAVVKGQAKKETLQALVEAKKLLHDPKTKKYRDVEEALQALKH